MGFLPRSFSLTLVPGNNHSVHHSFCATLFDGRPKEPSSDQETWASKVQQAFQNAVQRAASKVEAASLLIDAHGAFLLVDFRGKVSTSNAKSGLSKLLEGLPQPQQDHVLATFHPIDEYDKERIEDMQTVAACEPAPSKRATPPSTHEWVKATKCKSLTDKIAAFWAENDPDDDETPPQEALVPITTLVPIESQIIEHTAKVHEKEVALRVLTGWHRMVQGCLFNWCLANESKFFDSGTNEPTFDLYNLELQLHNDINYAKLNAERFQFWKESVAINATVVVASAGVHSLTFERCYKPERCELLLAKRLQSNSTLLGVVRAALKMVEMGQLHKPQTQKQRYQLQLLCSRVVAALNPTTPNIPKDLPSAERDRIQAALLGQELPEDNPQDTFAGCFSCLAEDPEWVVQDMSLPGEALMPLSRCIKCQCPKAYGRHYKRIGDVVTKPCPIPMEVKLSKV